MFLTPGARIGTYEITGKLGEGGMGEVYRARDTRLDRDVAIKILPDLVAADPDRVARFEREAKTLAALNHPNIAHIYDAGRADAVAYLAMELVEGLTLAEMIELGQPEAERGSARLRERNARQARGGWAPRELSNVGLPLDEVLPIARQIADALETAHEQGIVHRDLKPANIKVRADGTVKVLDFGLAKALDAGSGSAASGDLANSPTLTARATQIGMILGTAAYMAPEQARGRPVDRRADIWAFGVVLYEMLTGRRAFEGEDVSITLASVLKEDVKWDALPADLPASVTRLLRRCLEKDPKRRLSAIGDARIELDDASAPADVTASAPRRSPARIPWLVAGVAILIAAGSVAMQLRPASQAASAGRMHFEVIPTTDARGTVISPSISPDGKWLAYTNPMPTGGPGLIWLRAMSDATPRVLAGTEGAATMFWSPDSTQIGYTTATKVLRVSIAGGLPQPIVDLSNTAGAAWSSAGEILIVTGPTGRQRMVRIPAEGGKATDVPAHADGPRLSWPSFLPDGRHFLALDLSLDRNRAVYIGSLDGTPPVKLLDSTSTAVYSPTGHVLFMRESTLYAQVFNAESKTLSGEAFRVADNVAISANTARTTFSVSDTGILSFRQVSDDQALADLVWTDKTGKTGALLSSARPYNQIRLSPDGKRLAFAEVDQVRNNYRLGVIEMGNGIASMMTDDKNFSNDPVWSPDSKTVVYESVRAGLRQFFSQPVGAFQPTTLFESQEDPKWVDDLSPDGKFLLFHIPRPSKLYSLELVQGQRTPKTVIDSQETIDQAHFSPDGKWVAYGETDRGIYHVWVASFPAFDKRQRVTPDGGGGQAVWRKDGRELYYLTYTGKLMSVRVTPSGGSLEFARPVEMFQSPVTVPGMGLDQYAVTEDGRFIFIRGRLLNSKAVIAVILNWADGLGKK